MATASASTTKTLSSANRLADRDNRNHRSHHLATSQITSFSYSSTKRRPMYTKLFAKILDSSIWLEPMATRIVWITLLAAMNEDGYAHFSAIENLANRARVTKEEAEKAIECFTQPDPNSANPDNGGRRVERVPGGFLVLNAETHRRTMNREIQRQQTRERVRKYKEKKKSNAKALPSVTSALPNVTPVYASVYVSSSISNKKEKLNKETVWEELKKNPAYQGIDIEKEFFKMEAWCKVNRKIPTEKRFVNWLNNAEKPMAKIVKGQSFKASDEEWEKLPQELKDQLTKTNNICQ
jgi:hypothetical protein